MQPAPFLAKQTAFKRAQPLSVYLELTYRCNWRCVFCYNPRHFNLRGMSAAEWTEVLDDLRHLGTLSVTLTGGEPLTHPEFFEIARAARQRAFAIRLFTNGALITDEVAGRIAELFPQTVELSLHGATAETHDRTTGRAGSFEAMWNGIRNLQRHGVRLVLKTPLTSINEHELDQMIDLVHRENLQYRVDPSLTPRDDGDTSPLAYAPSPDAVRKLMRSITETVASASLEYGGSTCGLGRLTLAVDPEGNVFPCIQWRHSSLGNVRTTPLREMWHASSERQNAANVAREANGRLLQIGGAVASFPFCPAIAQQLTGDPLTVDARQRDRAELAEEIRSELSQ